MPPTTPYTADLDNREPVSAMRDTAARIRAVVGEWRPDQFERSYAPGKWDARQILTHLAQSEIALGYRARMALTTPAYAAQMFDQDSWMARESTTSGHDAPDAFGTAAMNIPPAPLEAPADALTPQHADGGSSTDGRTPDSPSKRWKRSRRAPGR
jgi:hypothetical protein